MIINDLIVCGGISNGDDDFFYVGETNNHEDCDYSDALI